MKIEKEEVTMRIAVIDGQGGGVGKSLVAALSAKISEHNISITRFIKSWRIIQWVKKY